MGQLDGETNQLHTMGFSFLFSFFFFLFYLGSIEISATLPPRSGNDKNEGRKIKGYTGEQSNNTGEGVGRGIT